MLHKKFLVLTNAYPSEDQLYRNGFIHRRVKSYQDFNIEIEVFVLNPAFKEEQKYQFDGINVYRGNKSHFEEFLRANEYRKTLIHFVSTDMIDVIHKIRPQMPLIIWIHGFEAEAWHRRWFNFLESKNQLKRILNMSNSYYKRQLEMLNWLFQTDELDIQFVHVSKWFKEHIVECDVRAKAKTAHIIPNFIDEKLFRYTKKKDYHRLKILSIRPYASRKYANDLAVKAVLELSKRPYFNRLEFAFYGEGVQFEQTIKPISNFRNVHIHRGFLKQEEIAKLHQEYGVFLCPTRLDSQGVSMCEAMSSGLVPISTNITAIPEFIEHDNTGILTKPEDYLEIANQIERIYFNKDLFHKLSRNASKFIIDKCGENKVIRREVELILSCNLDKSYNNYINQEILWREMYEELEQQIHDMMEMTLELLNKETTITDNLYNSKLEEPQDIKKELRRLMLFEHSIKVTWLGRITLKYIAMKKEVRNLLTKKRKDK